MSYYIGLDIGGSHITSGLVSIKNGQEKIENITHYPINSNASADVLIANITDSIVETVRKTGQDRDVEGVGISMPGPFDYSNGISKINGVNKFDSIFGIDLKKSLLNSTAQKNIAIPKITFLNDAEAFLKGVLRQNNYKTKTVLALTIGTGIGSASYSEGNIYSGVMDDEYLYNRTFKGARAEDYFSTKWFLNRAEGKGIIAADVKELSDNALTNPEIQKIFNDFGKNLALFLNELLSRKEINQLVFGGNIFQSYRLFGISFREHFSHDTEINIIDVTSEYSVIGGAVQHANNSASHAQKIRSSVSSVLPVQKETEESEGYDIYPSFSIGSGKIQTGYESLKKFITSLDSDKIVIDGNVGTLWDEVVSELNTGFTKSDAAVNWYCIDAAFKSEDDIASMLEKYLGGDDPLFGFNYPGNLQDFFDQGLLERITPNSKNVSVLYGTGAALAGWDAPVIYIDQPKNEIKFRSRAGSVSNIGSAGMSNDDPKSIYKRFYFVDWPVCNKHKQNLLPKITAVADGQRPGTITWMEGADFRDALDNIVKNPFRVRPWFEPGVWGGQWMKEKFEGLNSEAENFAWSFEIIAPENGVIFESDNTMLETGFEFLMYQNNRAILGNDADTYGYYFPLRFDYLDTMDGENLSLQCHPKLEYMRRNFGELITQDETYYIMDAEPDAEVYLGFQESINPDEFRAEFEECEKSGKKADVEKYVQTFPSQKHDLFLIPAGTVHCSGKNNMVLEISNTPYIFTFKIYDWQRLDLDGKPRTLNIRRALENLYFGRKGSLIPNKFISKPETIDKGKDWKVVNLPTHETHLYSVHRMEFEKSIQIKTENRFHVLNLVEGSSVNIVSNNQKIKLQYAETIVIPAATGEYTIENDSDTTAKVVKAFMK